ncbi:TetR family transcriptional regulator [Leucobacter sp. PH1c]|uniref:TetR family transcriptional regulator n=1 Tax=Leucobacter sp. PH1c TaxID=1397278 RepID=UPI000468D9A3|nr:TetR family transcriptional regulator [Leucobacter sp. PH1c]
MAYLPRDERRAALIDAALRVIRSGGFAAVSARSVAQEIGGSPGLIHQHFASVGELTGLAWRQYVDENLAEFAEAVGAGGADPRAEFFANHRDGDRDAELGLWADAWAHAMRAPQFAEVFAESLDALAGALRGAAPELSAVDAERVVLLGVALAGMRRVAPDRYGVERAAEIIGG